MHAFLTCSALHLAYIFPSRQQLCLLRAHSHQDVALPLFRRAIANVTESNCHSILAFSHFLVVYSFAADRADEHLLLVDPSSPYPDLLCSWLYFARNDCLLVCERWDTIETGPLGPLAKFWDSPTPGLEDCTTEPDMTDHLLSLMPTVGGTEDEEVWPHSIREVYRDTAAQLGWAFAATRALSGVDFTTWDAVRVWLMKISVAYIELLIRGHSAALVLLAHYCLLLDSVQPHWYLAGRAKKLLDSVLERLDFKWRLCIRKSLEKLSSLSRGNI